jgi:ATP-binding cassette subfamily B protein
MSRPESLQRTLPILGRFVRRFWPALRKHRGVMAGSVLVLISEVFVRLLEPWPLSFVIDHVIAPVAPGRGPQLPGVEALSDRTLITAAALALVCFAGLRALSRYLSAVGFALTGNRFLTEVRDDLYRHLHALSLSFHARSRSGDLLVRVIGDVALLREVMVTALLPLLGNCLILTGMLLVMLWMDWRLALVAASTVPLFWLSTVHLGRRIQATAREQRRREGGLASTAAESIGAIQTVQAYSLDGIFSRAFRKVNQQSLREGVRGQRLAARLERTIDVLSALAQALVLWFGAHAVLSGRISPGELLVFLAYLRGAFQPVRNFAKYAARLAKASAAGERVLEVMDREPDVRDLPGAVEAPALRGAIRFEEVCFAYEPGHPVLERISFEVRPGQRAAIVGPSGSGKSTILRLVLRLFDPTHGRVLVDGRDLRDFTLASLRAQMGVVLEDTLLFAASVHDNIAYGRTGATPEEVVQAARLADADDFVRALPEAYASVLGERGVTLSKGQRQRLAVARAALRRAPLLLLDEPTNGLDEESEHSMLEALGRLARGRTTLLVTHELEHATRCDTILFVENGRIAERGTHAELLALGSRYAAMYRMQASLRGGPGGEGAARALAG